MVIYRRSDSLSQCDPSHYSNLYDVTKRPDIKNKPVSAAHSIHKDTIEISRDKLKGEALKRLRHTSKYMIAQNSFMRIGKYLFLAIAFPPYLALYGLPKWILVEGIPAIYSMTVWMWKKIQKQTKKHIDAGTQKLIQITQYVQSLARALIQPLVHLALEIQQSFRRRRDQVLKFFRRRMQKSLNALGLPKQKIKAKLKNVQERLAQIKEKFSQKIRLISLRVQEGIQWIKEAPQKFLGWSQEVIQNVKQRTEVLAAGWKTRFQYSQKLAEKASNWVDKKINQGIEGVKKQFSPLLNFYRQKLKPPLQKISKICGQKWQNTKDFCDQKHQKILHFLQSKQDKLKHLSSNRFLQHLLSYSGKLPSFWQEWFKKVLTHSFTRGLCDKLIQCYAFFAKCLLQIAKVCMQMAAYGATFFIKAGNSVRRAFNLCIQYLFSFLNICLNNLLKGLLYFVYYTLLFSMISFILFIWGLRYLSNRMSALTARFSLPRFK